MSDFDVIIVGGGIAGASLGAEIAAERRTLIVEAEDHCGYHSTGRSAAFFLESYGGPEVAAADDRVGPLPRSARRRISRSAGSFAGAAPCTCRDDGWPELPPAVAARRIERAELERDGPGVRPRWTRALFEPGCADIDVAALHAAYLRQFQRAGGEVRCGSGAAVGATFERRALVGRRSRTARRLTARCSSMPPAPGPIASPRRCGVRAARHRAEAANDGPAARRPIRPQGAAADR